MLNCNSYTGLRHTWERNSSHMTWRIAQETASYSNRYSHMPVQKKAKQRHNVNYINTYPLIKHLHTASNHKALWKGPNLENEFSCHNNFYMALSHDGASYFYITAFLFLLFITYFCLNYISHVTFNFKRAILSLKLVAYLQNFVIIPQPLENCISLGFSFEIDHKLAQ